MESVGLFNLPVEGKNNYNYNYNLNFYNHGPQPILFPGMGAASFGLGANAAGPYLHHLPPFPGNQPYLPPPPPPPPFKSSSSSSSPYYPSPYPPANAHSLAASGYMDGYGEYLVAAAGLANQGYRDLEKSRFSKTNPHEPSSKPSRPNQPRKYNSTAAKPANDNDTGSNSNEAIESPVPNSDPNA